MTFSDLFYQLWDKGLIQLGVWGTIYMTLISTGVAYLLGLPLGVLLRVTARDGIHPVGWLNSLVGVFVNIFRSIPFMIVMLIIAAAPYVARMVESSLREIKPGIIEAAQAMGTPNFTIIWKVMLPEAKPSLITGAVISTVTILGYSAMAGTIGGTGLGQIAISYGYQRFKNDIIWVCMILIVLIVQVIQIAGTAIAHRTDKRIRH